MWTGFEAIDQKQELQHSLTSPRIQHGDHQNYPNLLVRMTLNCQESNKNLQIQIPETNTTLSATQIQIPQQILFLLKKNKEEEKNTLRPPVYVA